MPQPHQQHPFLHHKSNKLSNRLNSQVNINVSRSGNCSALPLHPISAPFSSISHFPRQTTPSTRWFLQLVFNQTRNPLPTSFMLKTRLPFMCAYLYLFMMLEPNRRWQSNKQQIQIYNTSVSGDGYVGICICVCPPHSHEEHMWQRSPSPSLAHLLYRWVPLICLHYYELKYF